MTYRLAFAVLIAVVGLLLWNSARATDPATSALEPSQITTHATHDTIRISWDTAVSGAIYKVELLDGDTFWSPVPRYGVIASETYAVGREAPFELTISGLDPDSVYFLWVSRNDRKNTLSIRLAVRTEPVPDNWWDMYIARDFESVAYRDALLLVWSCLDFPYVDRLEVEMREYGAPDSEIQARTVLCAADRSVLGPLLQGTVYDITIYPTGMEHYQRRLLATIPSAIRAIGLSEQDVPTWDASVSHSRDVRGWEFTATVDTDEPASLFEVEWLRDGHRITRVGPGPKFVYRSDSPGPILTRIRAVSWHGSVSPWSASRLVGEKPSAPSDWGIQYQRRGSRLHVTWPRIWHPSGVDGYRAFLLGGAALLQDVATDKSRYAVFELDPEVTQYELFVGTYNNLLGLSELTHVHVDLGRQPELLLRVDDWQPYCQPGSGSPMRGYWSIKFGEPPYRVTVGARDAVTTVLPYGGFEAGCSTAQGERTDDGVPVTQVLVEVEDGLGRRTSELLSYEIRGQHEPGATQVSATEKPGPVGVQVRRPSVGSTGLSAVLEERSTQAQYSLARFVIRWRSPGQRSWTYERKNVDVALTRVATVLWRGLRPNTVYQYQMAVDILGVSPEEIPESAWSTLQEVQTLPEEFRTRVLRTGSSVTVSWEPAPTARLYNIVLRSHGQSWWKTHDPGSADVASVVFRGVPSDAVLDIEVITPLVGDLQWYEVLD